jgi:hypothetical protein
MFRGSKRSFFSAPAVQVVNNYQSLNTEKNELLSIMSQYLSKQSDKATALNSLTALEVKLTTPA